MVFQGNANSIIAGAGTQVRATASLLLRTSAWLLQLLLLVLKSWQSNLFPIGENFPGQHCDSPARWKKEMVLSLIKCFSQTWDKAKKIFKRRSSSRGKKKCICHQINYRDKEDMAKRGLYAYQICNQECNNFLHQLACFFDTYVNIPLLIILKSVNEIIKWSTTEKLTLVNRRL